MIEHGRIRARTPIPPPTSASTASHSPVALSASKSLWSLIRTGRMHVIAVLVPLALNGCLTQTTLGEGGSIVAGSASESENVASSGDSSTGSGSTASGEAKELQKCSEPFATVALSEDEANKQQYVTMFTQLQLPQSPLPLLRLMFQQSNCFQIVDRGRGLQAISTEQQLAKQGMLRQGSDITGGQLVAADYTITPNIVFSNQNAGGIGAAAGMLGAVIPGAALLGGINVSMKEAQVVLFLTDNRSGIQIAAAEGSAKTSDVGFGGFGLGGGLGVVGGAWGSSAQGKVVAAALLDAANKVIDIIRSK